MKNCSKSKLASVFLAFFPSFMFGIKEIMDTNTFILIDLCVAAKQIELGCGIRTRGIMEATG
jgi:hypothetical protein